MAASDHDPSDPASALPSGDGGAAGSLRSHLRELILGGSLQPGSVISQVELARSLGVSRTPLREALRMLQEEGLIEAEPNRRARVASFDPADLDAVYGCRVMLESLACSLSVRDFGDEEIAGLKATLEEMSRQGENKSIEGWQAAHREFHRLLVARNNDQFARTIAAYQDRSERYWLMFIQPNGGSGLNMRESEHRAIYEAASRRDAAEAGSLLARHLSRTALTLMAQLAPEFEPTTVRTAMKLVTGSTLSSA